jgi:type VI secretion system protein ImpK
LVTVTQRDDAEVVTLRGDGLFDSGSSALRSGFVPVLERIADALNQVPGPVLITGHTDNQPIFSARHQSNWHLSKERAESVMALLAGRMLAANRLRAEGRADREPTSPNDSPENRARNRRVEITVGAAAVTGARAPAGLSR